MSKEYNKSAATILDNIYAASNGFSEDQLAQVEKKYNIRIPEVLREYYLKHGKHKLNYTYNRLFTPEEVCTLYSYFDTEHKDDPEDFEDTYGVSLAELKESTANYLLFYCENQGVWQAGMMVEELHEPNPKVFYDNLGIDNWTFMSNSVGSFLLSMLWENLRWSGFKFERHLKESEKVEEAVLDYGIDFPRLMDSKLDNKNCRTCFDSTEKKLYFFLVNKAGRLVELIVADYALFSEKK